VDTTLTRFRPGFLHHTISSPLLAEYPLTILDCYAKSPEWPCPADTEDARDVYQWVLQNPALFDKERITLGGFSAGATVALGLSLAIGAEARQRLLDSSERTKTFVHPIRGVFAMYPVVTWEGSRSEVTIPPEARNKPGVLLPRWF
jgi:acetyl esterase/lipase